MKPILALVGVASLVAALVWARSTRRLHVVWKRVENEHGPDADVTVLARSAFRKDLHATCLYGVLALAAAAVAATGERAVPSLLFVLILVPVALSIAFGRDFAREAVKTYVAVGANQQQPIVENAAVSAVERCRRWQTLGTHDARETPLHALECRVRELDFETRTVRAAAARQQE